MKNVHDLIRSTITCCVGEPEQVLTTIGIKWSIIESEVSKQRPVRAEVMVPLGFKLHASLSGPLPVAQGVYAHTAAPDDLLFA